MTLLFGWPAYSDLGVSFSPALSGGSWLAALPLTNLQDRRLSRVARSTNALAASTTFDVDLGTARAVGVLAVLIPNLTKTPTPTIQWKGASDAGFASLVYNPGAVQAWPSSVGVEDVTDTDGNQLNVWLTTIPASPQTARFWRLAIVDTANASGYLDVARVIIAGAYQPAEPIAVGQQTGYTTATVRTDTDGSSTIYQAKKRRRMDTFTVPKNASAEAYSTIRKMQRQLGISGQFFWVPETTDATNMWERAYLATVNALSPLQYSMPTRLDAQFSVVEEL